MMKCAVWISLLFCLSSFVAFASGEPAIVSSVFSQDGSSVVITFDSPVANTYLNVPFKCGVVLSTATVNSLGQDSACYWKNDSVVVAFLGASSTLSVGSTIAANGTFGTSQVTLGAPVTAGPPIIDIVGPATITTCEQEVVVSYAAQILEGSNGVALSDGITWSIAAFGGGSLPASLTDVFASTKARVVQVSASLLEPGNYIISATATNMFGVSKTATYNIFKSTEQGPITVIQAPSRITVDPAKPLSLKGQVTSLCQVQRQMTFSWSQAGNSNIPLVSSSRLNNELYFPANTFGFGGTYQLRFSAVAGALSGYSTITIVTITEFYARIVPAQMVVSRIADFSIDATDSVVPSGSTFSWRCYDINTPDVSCLDSVATAAFFGNRKSITIPQSTLHQGTYLFVVTITNGAQSRNATCTVSLLHEAAPTVTISPSAQVVNPTVANVFSSPAYSSIVSYSWTISPAATLLFANSPSVEIAAHTLQQGVSYTLKLLVKTSDKNASEAITFVADVAPFGGICTARELSASQFFVQCEDWKVLDPYGLLSYYFSYYDVLRKAEIPLHGTPGLSNFIIATVPPYTTTIYARVSAAWGSQSTYINISVVPRSLEEVTLGGGNVTGFAADRVAENMLPLSYMRNADNIGQFVCFIGSLLESDVANESAVGDRVWIHSQLTGLLAKSFITVDSSSATLAKAYFLRYAVGANYQEVDDSSQQNGYIVARDIVYANSHIGNEHAISQLTMHTLSVIIRASAESPVIDVESEEYANNKTTFNIPRTSDYIAALGDAAVIDLISPISNTSYASELATVVARKALPTSLPTTLSYGDSNITLPQSAITKILSTTPTYVAYVWINFPSNPFAWANTTSTLNSPVVDFTIKTESSSFKLDGLADPIKITVPSLAKYVSFAHARCQFWNTTEQAWSTNGCTLGLYDVAHTNCLCNHLSVFSAAQGPIPPPPVLSNPVRLGDDDTIQWWLFAGIIGFALLVLIGFVAYRLRAKHGVPQEIERGPTRLFAKQIKDIEANFKYGPVLKKVHFEEGDDTDESEAEGEITEKVKIPLVAKQPPKRMSRKAKHKKPPPRKQVVESDRSSRSASPEIKRGLSIVRLPVLEAPKVPAVAIDETPTPTPRVVTPPPRVLTPPPKIVTPREPSPPPKPAPFQVKLKPVPPPKPAPPPREPSPPPPPPKEPTPPPSPKPIPVVVAPPPPESSSSSSSEDDFELKRGMPIKKSSSSSSEEENDELKRGRRIGISSSSDSEEAEHMRRRGKQSSSEESNSESEGEELVKSKSNNAIAGGKKNRSDSSDTSSDSDSNERSIVKAKMAATPFGTKKSARDVSSDSSSTSSDSDDDIKKPSFAQNFGSVRGKPPGAGQLRIAEQSSSSPSSSSSDSDRAPVRSQIRSQPPARRPPSDSDSDSDSSVDRKPPARLTRKNSSSSSSSSSSSRSGPRSKPLGRKNSTSSSASTASSRSIRSERAAARRSASASSYTPSDSDSDSRSDSDSSNSDSEKSKEGYISPRGKRGSKTLTTDMTGFGKDKEEKEAPITSRSARYSLMGPINPVNPPEEDTLASPRHSLSMSPPLEEEEVEPTKKKDVRVTPLKLTSIRKSEASEEKESGSSKSHREMI